MMLQGKIARDKFVKSNQETAKQAGQPNQDSLNLRYGTIHTISEDKNRLSVRYCDSAGKDLDEISPMFPYINPMSQIFLLWGALREGLAVRVFFKGRDGKTDQGIIEIIGDEHPRTFLAKDIKANELETGPYLLISGGLLG